MAIAPPITSPSGQITGSDGVVTFQVFQGSVPNTDPVLVAKADPDRLVLAIQSDTPVQNWAASVARDTSGFGFHGIDGTFSLILHHAALPGLVQAAWYISSEVALASFRVYSITRAKEL